MSDPAPEPRQASASPARDSAELPPPEPVTADDTDVDDDDTIDAEEEDALRRFLSFLRFVEQESGSLDVDLSQPSHFNVEAEFYADVHGQTGGRLRGLRGSGRPRRFRRVDTKSVVHHVEVQAAAMAAENGEETPAGGLAARLSARLRSRPRLYLLLLGSVILLIIIIVLIWLI